MPEGRTNRGHALVAFSLLMTVALVACSMPATPTPSSPLPTASPTARSPTPTPTAESASPLVTTLTLWVPEVLDPYGETPESVLMAQHLDAFRETYPDLQVKVIVKKEQGRGGLVDFLRTASVAAPSVLPDLVVLNISDLRVVNQAGLLQPFNDRLPAELAADRFPFAAAMGELDGRMMAVPMGVNVEHMVYRPALLSSAPVTWTDVLSAGVPFVFPAGGHDGGVNNVTLVQYLGASGRLTDEEGNPTLEVEPLTAVLSFYAQASAAEVVSPTVVLALTDTEGCWERLQEDSAAMAVVDFQHYWSEPSLAIAPAPIPARSGGVAFVQDGWALGLVTADTDRQEKAMLLAQWLLDAERLGTWTQSAGYLPAFTEALGVWTVSEQERAALEAVLESVQPRPPTSVRAVVGPVMQSAVEATLAGRRNPAEAAAEAAQAVNP